MGREYEPSQVHNRLLLYRVISVVSMLIWGLSRWLFLSRVVFLLDGHEQTHFYRPFQPSSPSSRTRSLLFLSMSVRGWEDVWVDCDTLFVCGILGWPCDDIISTSAPVLPCNLDTILFMTPERCQRSG